MKRLSTEESGCRSWGPCGLGESFLHWDVHVNRDHVGVIPPPEESQQSRERSFQQKIKPFHSPDGDRLRGSSRREISERALLKKAFQIVLFVGRI